MKGRLTLLIGAYTVAWTALSLARYAGFNATTFDLGIHTEIMRRLSHGAAPQLISRGLNAFGDHYTPIAFALVPIFWVSSSPVALLVVQSLVLALGAVPVYRLARRTLGSSDCGLIFAALFLLQPILHYCNRFDFHFSSLFIPLFLLALDGLEEGRALAYAASLLLVLATGEAAGFSVLGMVPAAGRRGWRWGVGTAAAGVAGLAVAGYTMSVASHGAPTQYTSLYANWGSNGASILTGLCTRPQDWMGRLWDPAWVGQMVLPLAGLPLLAPQRLLPALPVLLGNQLSWRGSQQNIDFHYNAAVLPFLMWAAIGGARRLSVPRQSALGALATVGALIGLWLGPLSPWGWERARPYAAELAAHLAQLPPGAVVAAQNLAGPHLYRQTDYLFPNPFQEAAWGHRPQALAEQSEHGLTPMLPGEARRSQAMSSAEYVVLMPESSAFPVDWHDLPVYLELLANSRTFGLVHRGPNLLIFKRHAAAAPLTPQDWPRALYQGRQRVSTWPVKTPGVP